MWRHIPASQFVQLYRSNVTCALENMENLIWKDFVYSVIIKCLTYFSVHSSNLLPDFGSFCVTQRFEIGNDIAHK
jgi:hypothetical protein